MSTKNQPISRTGKANKKEAIQLKIPSLVLASLLALVIPDRSLESLSMMLMRHNALPLVVTPFGLLSQWVFTTLVSVALKFKMNSNI